MHTRSRWTYGLIALLLLSAVGLAVAAPINPESHKADPAAKYISRAVEDRTSPLYAGPGEPTAAALRARGQPSFIGPLPKRGGDTLMPALVRIGSEAAVAKMRAMGCFVGAVIGDIATARIPVDKLATVADMSEIEYLKYAPKRDLLLDVSVPEVGGDLLHDIGLAGQGVIVGIVDTGIDWRHQDLLNPDGTSRILYLWDQTDPVGPTPPPPFDYGTLWTKADIDAALQDMGLVRQADWMGHGTHVAGIAAGNGFAPGGFYGMAPLADLIVVHAPFDTDVGATDQDLIDGNAFVAQKAFELGRPVVINNSWGGHFGEPHDGYGMVETAMSDLADQGVVIVAAAGNEGDSLIHAGTSINRTRDRQWHFWISEPPGYLSPVMAVDIWYPAGTELEFTVAYDWTPPPPDPDNPPPGPPMPCLTQQTNAVATGSADSFDIPSRSSWGGTVVDIDATDVNDPGVDPPDYANHALILVVTPFGGGFYPLGIVVSFVSGEPAFDAWASAAEIWDIPCFDLTACPIDPTDPVDPLDPLEPFDPLQGFWIPGDNLKTVSPPSTGDEIISVAAYNTKCAYLDKGDMEQDFCSLLPVGSASFFSSLGPRRDEVRKPDIAAPGAMVASALSMNHTTGQPLNPEFTSDMITPDGEHVVLAGTSMATPHVAGAIALMLEKNRFLTPDDVRHFLLLTARPGNLFRSGWDPIWGWGKLDARAAADLVQEVQDVADPRQAEVGIDFTAPIATIDVEYGIAEMNWLAEFSGVAFDEFVLEPLPIPLDNIEILQNHWALNDQIIRVVLRTEDVRLDPDGTYNFYKVDPLIKAVLDAGAKPMICVCEVPMSWTNWQIATWFHMVAVHFAAQYDLTGWYWQILDRADLQYWEPMRPRWDPWEYMLMFNQVYDSLKQAAPTSKVGGPGLSQYDDLYVEALLRAVRTIDFISWHAEGATTVPRGNSDGVLNAALHTIGRDIDRATAMIARWKAGVEIVVGAYNLNAWRPVTGDFSRTVETDPRLGEAAGAAWNVGALRELILSPHGHSAQIAVLQEATDGVQEPDAYMTPGTYVSYDPFAGRGLWLVNDPTSRTPAFFAQRLFNYYLPTGSDIVQAYSSDPFVSVLATSNGDPAVNVALINTSPWQVTTQLALTGLPYYQGTWYTVDEFSSPGFATQSTSLGSIQTVTLEPYAVRILNIRDQFNLLKTPGLDVGGSVRGDRLVARDWVSHDGLRHPGVHAISTETKHSGHASQAISGGPSGGERSIWQQTAIGSVQPGVPYIVSAYVRPRSVVFGTAGGGAFIRVEFLDQFARPLDPPVVYESTRLLGTADFQRLYVRGPGGQPRVTAPTDARCMKVELALLATGGTAFFDRVYAGRGDVEPTPSGGTIWGTVWAQDFTPIPGVKVSVRDEPYFTYTRSDGSYEIDFVPQGAYTVVAAKEGYQTATTDPDSVLVYNGGRTQVDFKLKTVGGLLWITHTVASKAQVRPGETNVQVTMLVDWMGDKDIRIYEDGIRFWLGSDDVTDEYTIVPDPSNPTILRAHTTSNAFNFLVSVGTAAHGDKVEIDGFISGYLNLVSNGSFEVGTNVPPPGWVDRWGDSEITQVTAYEGANCHRGWFWKDEWPIRGWIESLNPITVQGNSFYRIGFAYQDLQALGETDLFYYVNEYDAFGYLVTWTGWTLDHADQWLLREGSYRVQPETRSVILQIGMQGHSTPSPWPVPQIITADLWVDDVFVEPDSPITDTGADVPGSWQVVTTRGSMTLDAGWNMISLPADPIDPDPEAVFAGIPIDYALYRYDPAAGGYIAYTSAAPGQFGACRAGDGYWLYLDAPAAISYLSAGTRYQQITVSRPGWAMVGLPQLEPASVATCLVDSGSGMLMMPGAVDAGWVTLPMYFYRSDIGGYSTCGIDVWSDDDTLRPWVGYWLYSDSPWGGLIVVP